MWVETSGHCPVRSEDFPVRSNVRTPPGLADTECAGLKAGRCCGLESPRSGTASSLSGKSNTQALGYCRHPSGMLANSGDIISCGVQAVAVVTASSLGTGAVSAGMPSAKTQVSLLPPPWDELTTSEPFLSATRVKPPGSTKMSLP